MIKAGAPVLTAPFVLLIEEVAAASLLPIVVVEVVMLPVLVEELPVVVRRGPVLLAVALTVPTTTRFPGTIVLYLKMSSVCGTSIVDKRVVS